MRLIAALLIVTIHTSPLSSYTETGDFILTRIIARIAVPFFFMTSGFFLISRYNDKPERLKNVYKADMRDLCGGYRHISAYQCLQRVF